jgi:hypothetical protein
LGRIVRRRISLAGTLNLVRPYQGFDAINSFMPVFTSNYNALQAQFQ